MAVSSTEVVNLYKILLQDLSELEIVDSKLFTPNTLNNPEIPLVESKVLGTNSKNIIGSINELLSEIQSVEKSIVKREEKRFAFLGDYLASPTIKTEILTLGSSLSDAFLKLAKEIYGSDLSTPKSLDQSIRDTLGLPVPTPADYGKVIGVSTTGTYEYVDGGGTSGGVSFSGDPSKLVLSNDTGDGLISSTFGISDLINTTDVIDNFESSSGVDVASARTVHVLKDLLDKLLPAAPDGISSLTPPVITGRSATHINGDYVSRITVSNAPVFNLTGVYKSESGTLSAELFTNNSPTGLLVGSIDLSTLGVNGGQDGVLDVSAPRDPYLGQDGKENFFEVRDLTFTSIPLSFTSGVRNNYVYKLSHTDPAESLTFSSIEIDEKSPTPLSISAIDTEILSIVGTLRKVAGVDFYAPGTKLVVKTKALGCVSNFYPSTPVKISGSSIVYRNLSVAEATSGLPTVYDDQISFDSFDVSFADNIFAIQPSIYLKSYNIYGDSSPSFALQTTADVMVDTRLTLPARTSSGIGDYPLVSTLGVYSYDESLLLSEELQDLGGVIQYPAGDYTAFGGPNYDGISGFRWYTKKLTGFQGVGAKITFTSSRNFGGTTDAISPGGIKIQVKVDGATPTPWLDAQAAYEGIDPTSEGMPCLLTADSTGSLKTVTFGVGFKKGDLYVRIGLPTGDNKTFNGISILPIG